MPRLQHADLAAAIKNCAWQQIGALGPGALSLRAIARALGITAPAIYNYFPRRDDLVTALIIDAFTSFGDAQTAAAADAASSTTDPKARLTALGLAYRAWAIANPHRYQLIFGAPVPGYDRPTETLGPVGIRAVSALVTAVESLYQSGLFRGDHLPEVSTGNEDHVAFWLATTKATEPKVIALTMSVWGRVHGLVSLEIAGHLPPFGAHGDALYRYELDALWLQHTRSPSIEEPT